MNAATEFKPEEDAYDEEMFAEFMEEKAFIIDALRDAIKKQPANLAELIHLMNEVSNQKALAAGVMPETMLAMEWD